jgi:sulfatase modifying factor 1
MPGRGFAHAGVALGGDHVDLPGGTFVMGTGGMYGYADDGEGPAHEVDLAPFSIGRDAVTNAEFAAFVEATGHRTEAEAFGWSFV